MNHAIEEVSRLLHHVRDGFGDINLRLHWFNHLNGFLSGLFWACVIDIDQYQALGALATDAFFNSGKSFPHALNAGPLMPASVRYERNKAAVKPQAVPVNEPVQLQPLAAPRKLLLLCLLGRSPGSKITRAFAQPVGVSRLPAPWLAPSARWGLCLSRSSAKRSAVSGIWPIQNSPGLVLREAHAVAPTAEVLARLQRHWQTNAICTAARTVQFGVTA